MRTMCSMEIVANILADIKVFLGLLRKTAIFLGCCQKGHKNLSEKKEHYVQMVID